MGFYPAGRKPFFIFDCSLGIDQLLQSNRPLRFI